MQVASLAEAWIEMVTALFDAPALLVASLAEAWIEITSWGKDIQTKLCRLPRGGVD